MSHLNEYRRHALVAGASFGVGAAIAIWGVNVAAAMPLANTLAPNLPCGGRIRADCDGNADAGRFGPE
jgi:hypothetical protein